MNDKVLEAYLQAIIDHQKAVNKFLRTARKVVEAILAERRQL